MIEVKKFQDQKRDTKSLTEIVIMMDQMIQGLQSN
jgi:hypothetical protein